MRPHHYNRRDFLPHLRLSRLFFHTGNGTRVLINLKISTNFCDVLLLRGSVVRIQSVLKKAHRMLCNSTQMFSRDHRSDCMERRAFRHYISRECPIIKRTISVRAPARTLTHMSKNTVLHSKSVQSVRE